jgi:hypothetical protein
MLRLSLLQKSKKRRNGSPSHHGGLSASLRMDADYDVRVPNDYNEFKDLIRRRREAIRQLAKERDAEDAFRKAGGYPGQDEEEYMSESEADEEEEDSYRRSKMGRFAPPAIYHQANQNSSLKGDAAHAYQDEEDEKPYLSPPAQHVTEPIVAVAPISALSGEEAYQRRLAMSQFQARPTSSEPVGVSETVPDLAARSAMAAAIAARLAKAAPLPPSAPSQPYSTTKFLSSTSQPQQQEAGTFAERLMQKQGWQKGEALGAEGNKGMLNPILAEKVEAERQRQREEKGRERKVWNCECCLRR